MNFFDLAEYLVMVVWFKNLCVTTVQTAGMKCTVCAYDKMAGNMQKTCMAATITRSLLYNIKCNDSCVSEDSLDNE